MQLSAYQKFLGAIDTPTTEAEYVRKLKVYQEFFKIKSWDTYIQKGGDKIHEDIEFYIDANKKKNIKNTSIKSMLNPLILLLDMNRIVVYKKILAKKLPKDKEKAGGMTPYTTEEVYRMIKANKGLRNKAIIHFLASTGCRPAGIVDPILRIGHLEKMRIVTALRYTMIQLLNILDS